jgi:cardiolipin synthase (CMP-forming)
MNLPNTLTIGRVALVPITIWLIAVGRYQAAFWCFVIAGVTDAIDGWLARKLDQRTELGAYLDPIADKALLVSIYVTLAIMGHAPVWLAILVVFRDIVIVGAIILSWVIARPITIAPLYVSKMNTTGQIALAALILANLGFSAGLESLVTLATPLVGALTAASMVGYMVQWTRHMSESP